jgi:phage baseplate assembly protein W
VTDPRDRLLGTDLSVRWQEAGVDLEQRGGDLALVSGADRATQELALRLRVRRGDLARLGWPDYGSRLHELVGGPDNRRTRVRLMAFARAALAGDPLVAEVLEVAAESGEPGTVRLLLALRLVGEPDPITLVHPVELGAP